MSVYVITGKLGSGKTLVCVGRIHDYLRRGNRVATNLDIWMEHLAEKRDSMAYVERLPDYPTADALDALGSGNTTYDEEKNGLLVLDECGTWLNTRAYADKGRQPMLDWMLHARKKGWDVLLIVQDLQIIDKQVRLALTEHLVSCKRADRLAIPLLSKVIKLFTGYQLTFPKIHFATVRYGAERESPVVDRWWYAGKRFYQSYDTKQTFNPYYDQGTFCTLPKRYLVPQNPPKSPPSAYLVRKAATVCLALVFERLGLLGRHDWVVADPAGRSVLMCRQ
ncbi:zonular occludens toxin domain-containing protein [Thiobacillus sp. 65-1402]|uniref:zonular occludens toxin domain-containing protein n=1 Tax=Thiobacillus sp. 65-1402 TaxID=1895861 RepID=UPI0009677DB7|nr:zonular occludens toxin domain-containing protein [Thiobacillus sp. 65-1402]OJW81604.1 MAG: hypothetical protein BGO62_15510 [Thiobacillus sp. 65-1402]